MGEDYGMANILIDFFHARGILVVALEWWHVLLQGLGLLHRGILLVNTQAKLDHSEVKKLDG